MKLDQKTMITNKTNNKIISNKERYCTSLFSQALGLMFRKKQNLVLVFGQERRVDLHNLFVFYPIDILILDEDKKVIEIKENFKPFTFWSSKKKGKYVVELGLKKGNVGVGDALEFE